MVRRENGERDVRLVDGLERRGGGERDIRRGAGERERVRRLDEGEEEPSM